jgi:hypothetical protein
LSCPRFSHLSLPSLDSSARELNNEMKAQIQLLMVTQKPADIIRALEGRFPPQHLRSLPRPPAAAPPAAASTYPAHWTADSVYAVSRRDRARCSSAFQVCLGALILTCGALSRHFIAGSPLL